MAVAPMVRLPIAQYPDVAPPTIQVTATYPGANAETVASTVATPIELEVNGVERMLYMSSQCTNDGTYVLTVTFEVGTNLIESCARYGLHHIDIADDRQYIARVRSLAGRFKSSTAVFGCSSLPGISLALARALMARRDDERPVRIRTTLFIGNKNPKGEAAIRSLVKQLGKAFDAPQGKLRSFSREELVDLPVFGRRVAYDFECADYDLFDVPSISVRSASN